MSYRQRSNLILECIAVLLFSLVLLMACSDNPSGPEPVSSQWQTEPTGVSVSLLGVFGLSSHDIFAVGDSGIILHNDGTGWSAMDSHTDRLLHGIWGFAHDDLYAVGDSGLIMHYDGVSWDSVRWGGNDLFTVRGFAPDDIYALGRYGLTLHYDGSSWTELVSTEGVIGSFYGAWIGPLMSSAVGPNTPVLMAVGEPQLVGMMTDSGWTRSLWGTPRVLRGAWGRTSADLYVVGNNGYIGHLDSTGWNPMDDGGISDHIYGIDGTGDGRVMAVGLHGTILQLYDRRWQAISGVTDEHLYSLWISPGGSDVFVTGRWGLILHGKLD